jgi:hypothetical protein
MYVHIIHSLTTQPPFKKEGQKLEEITSNINIDEGEAKARQLGRAKARSRS